MVWWLRSAALVLLLAVLAEARIAADTNRRNLEKDIVLDFAPNGVCSSALAVQAGSIVVGNLDKGTLDQGTLEDCVSSDTPGLWYRVQGDGQVMRMSTVESNSTRLVIFAESQCNRLQCQQAIKPTLTRMEGRDANGWTTFWGTQQDQTYLLYLYGTGTFQMMMTTQKRPENDLPENPIELKIGAPLEGSTAFASPEESIDHCDGGSNQAEGVWFTISGTGKPLQAKLRTVAPAYKSQVSIYSQSMDCVQKVQLLEYFDVDHPQWYPISTALLWESQPGEEYKILVQGRPDEAPGIYDNGNFELTIIEHQRPENDVCANATELQLEQKISGSTDFATIDPQLVCSPVTLGEQTTAPGVWYTVNSNQNGRFQVSVESSYAAQVTVYQGNDHLCDDNLVCLEGTDNSPPDATDLTAVLSSQVQWDSEENATYYVLVHGSHAMAGIFDITLSSVSVSTPTPTPLPTTQPVDASTPQPEETQPLTATVWDVQTTASLAFGFFPGADVKSPPEDDVVSLMAKTSTFFTKTFQDVFDDAFIRFEATAYETTFDDQSALPVIISFVAKAYFTSEDSAATAEDMFGIMAGADFQNFIRSYAWQTEPFGETLFFQTLRVSFGEAKSQPPNAVGVQPDSLQEEAVQRVTVNAKILFSFFPDAQMREPTAEELHGLVKQTRSFFSKVFESQFDDFVRFGAVVSSTNYTEESAVPVTLSLDVSAFFSLNDTNGTTTETHGPAEILAAMENAKLTDFIQNYIWESEPFAENIFYETMHVHVKPDGNTDTSALSNGLHVVNAADKAVVHVALSYSFHNTATITPREPVPEEIDGLVNKTVEFFSQILLDELPNHSSIDRINLVATSVDYKEQSEFSVVVYSRLEVHYKEGSDASDRPTAEQVLALLETANMQDYVEYYVWFAEPLGSIFFATDQAVLEPYSPIAVGTLSPNGGGADSGAGAGAVGVPTLDNADEGGVTSDATLEPATLHQVETDLTALFVFFQGPSRVATQDELDALTSETTAFLTSVLHKVYDDLIRVDVELITAGFAETSNEPSVVSWKVSALFYVLDGTVSTRTPEHLLNILATSDVEIYLHKYVWNSVPLGGNLFFGASAVQFEMATSAIDSDTPALASTPDVPETAAPSRDQVVVRASIQYGFLDDIVITRKPTSEEEDGIRFQTSLFFNKLFRQHFLDESFKQLTASVKDVSLVNGDDFPIIISYEMVAQFDNSGSVPEVEELYEVMDDADFEEYIEFYVWSSVASADSMFFDTQRVVFQAVV